MNKQIKVKTLLLANKSVDIKFQNQNKRKDLNRNFFLYFPFQEDWQDEQN